MSMILAWFAVAFLTRSVHAIAGYHQKPTPGSHGTMMKVKLFSANCLSETNLFLIPSAGKPAQAFPLMTEVIFATLAP